MSSIQLGRIDTTISDALALLENDLVTLAGVGSSRLRFEVKMTLLTTTGHEYPLAVKVERSDVAEDRPYSFETSHHAHTPDQISAYITSVPYEDSVPYAVYRAIDSVKSYVDQAIESGHRFDTKWLVPNPNY
ncbi:hypothetical protein [Burkholderia guangdongensis]|uniref:hypothetical protein n=1 Tax=Burkholderia guangdongensis TaxID=1792500 RepID=UPI0015CE6815|nr:hypothetical protein [Burkholderia guangdongensis]